jgi:hypothetical protein
MLVKELIELLSKLPQDMPVGAANYYGTFGPAAGVEIEKASVDHWEKSLTKYQGQEAAVISFYLDLQ